jgi:vacuolar-type H+-ATPase subunit E/Vma4
MREAEVTRSAACRAAEEGYGRALQEAEEVARRAVEQAYQEELAAAARAHEEALRAAEAAAASATERARTIKRAGALRAESIYRAGVERAANLRDAISSYETEVSGTSHERSERLHAALLDHDAAMSRAAEAFDAVFSEGGDSGGVADAASDEPDVEGHARIERGTGEAEAHIS